MTKSTDVRKASGLIEYIKKLEYQVKTLKDYNPADGDFAFVDLDMSYISVADKVDFVLPYARRKLDETIGRLQLLGVEYIKEGTPS